MKVNGSAVIYVFVLKFIVVGIHVGTSLLNILMVLVHVKI